MIISTAEEEASDWNRFRPLLLPLLSKYIQENRDDNIDSCLIKANCELREITREQTAKHEHTLAKTVNMGGHYKPVDDDKPADDDKPRKQCVSL